MQIVSMKSQSLLSEESKKKSVELAQIGVKVKPIPVFFMYLFVVRKESGY